MSKNKNTTQTILTLLKRAIFKLTNKQDYKTLNTLFRCNPNTSKFDIRT